MTDKWTMDKRGWADRPCLHMGGESTLYRDAVSLEFDDDGDLHVHADVEGDAPHTDFYVPRAELLAFLQASGLDLTPRASVLGEGTRPEIERLRGALARLKRAASVVPWASDGADAKEAVAAIDEAEAVLGEGTDAHAERTETSPDPSTVVTCGTCGAVLPPIGRGVNPDYVPPHEPHECIAVLRAELHRPRAAPGAGDAPPRPLLQTALTVCERIGHGLDRRLDIITPELRDGWLSDLDALLPALRRALASGAPAASPPGAPAADAAKGAKP